MKQYSTREFTQILKNNGYQLNRTKGSHKIYVNGNRHLTVKDDMKSVICQRLIREYKLEAR